MRYTWLMVQALQAYGSEQPHVVLAWGATVKKNTGRPHCAARLVDCKAALSKMLRICS